MHEDSERRRSLRVPTLLYVRGLADAHDYSTELGDIGLGGVGFELAHAPADEVFRVRYSIPGEARLHSAFVFVVRSGERPHTGHTPRPYYVGARFLDLREDEARALARALDARERTKDAKVKAPRGGVAAPRALLPAPHRSPCGSSPSIDH